MNTEEIVEMLARAACLDKGLEPDYSPPPGIRADDAQIHGAWQYFEGEARQFLAFYRAIKTIEAGAK